MTASPAHCHYCFDVLASKLSRQQHLPLSEIEALYARQQKQQPRKSPAGQTNGATISATANGVSNVNGSSATTNNSASNGTYASAANSPYPKTPLFVTWKIKSKSGRMDLRGCIGTFEPKQLDAGLRDYAITACVSPSPHSSVWREGVGVELRCMQ